MNRRSALLSIAGALTALHLNGHQSVPSASLDSNLTVEEIVRRTHDNIPEDVIMTAIKKNGKAFDLSADEILDLHKMGVSDAVVKCMLDPSQACTPPQKVTTQPTKTYPLDPVAKKVPPDPGLYLLGSGNPIAIDLKVLLGSEETKGLMKKKGKSVAYLLGPSAKTRLKPDVLPFYLRIPAGKQIEEVLLVSFTLRKGRRELDVGPSGPKQEYNPADIHPFDKLEVDSQLYRLTVPKLPSGEYLFLFIGSADTSKGIYGKGYDFGVDGPPAPGSSKNKNPPKK